LILFERPNFNQENQTQMILFCLIGIYDFFTYNYIHCGPMVRTSSYHFSFMTQKCFKVWWSITSD